VKERLAQRILEQQVFVRLMPVLVRHVHGPTRICYSPEELIVLCVVRNGELYVRSFVDHYRSLGAKHIVFLDNGSTDATVELLRSYDVTVLQSHSRYRQQAMNLYLLRRYARNRWGLLADIDEFFDYPYSDRLSLGSFLRYLNAYEYTAVLTQVLDMFPAEPLDTIDIGRDDDIAAKYPYFDISAIRKQEYSWPGMSNHDIAWHFGGVRSTVFGTDSSLTKPALFLVGRRMTFHSVHHVKVGRVADISCLLRHYPFVGSFRTKVDEALRTGAHAKARWDYEGYARVLRREPRPVLASASAQRLKRVDDLIDEGFLTVSSQYREWVEANAHDAAPARETTS
jgi:Glycosyl transferase family 2